jgi:hypothetical protein
VILLPAVLRVAAEVVTSGDRRRMMAAGLAFVAIAGAALAMNVLKVESNRFVWMAPALLVAYVVLRPAHLSRPRTP